MPQWKSLITVPGISSFHTFVGLLALFVMAGCGGSPPSAPAPVANFIGTPTLGNLPLEVSFTDLSSGPINSWSWDFGDTGVSTEQGPTHTYTDMGSFAVTLTVTGLGGSHSRIRTDYITVGTPPLLLSKHRDSNNLIAPILSDHQTADNSSVPADFDYLEVDSPSIVDDDQRPDRWMLFYEGKDGVGNISIGLITSNEEDFPTLTVDRTQVMNGASMPDLNVNGTLIAPAGAADPTVLLDTSFAPGVDGRYTMWFEGLYGVAGLTSAILRTTSGDGVTWGNPVFCTGLEPGASFGNVVRVVDPSVERTISPTAPLQMAFEAERNDLSSVIGMAVSSDGIAWTIDDGVLTGAAASPVFTGGPGTFDDFAVQAPSIAREVDTSGNLIEWHLFYEALRVSPAIDNDSVIGYATSLDGFSWSGFFTPVLDPSSDLVAPPLFDSDDLKHPSVMLPEPEPMGPRFLLYYVGDPEVPLITDEVNRIGLADGS